MSPLIISSEKLWDEEQLVKALVILNVLKFS